MRQERSGFRVIGTVLLTLMVATISLTGSAGGQADVPDLRKLSTELELAWLDAASDDELRVVYQLHAPLDAQVEDELDRLGASLSRPIEAINGGVMHLEAGDLVAIAAHPAVRYLELDLLLESFVEGVRPITFVEGNGFIEGEGIMMHNTTHVIQATEAWDRLVIDAEGDVMREADGTFREFDGKGVTVVDLDTGVDAGHPDFDYTGDAWQGKKTIYSAKNVGGTWVQQENSDTSSGHGTHVAGTLAGNGDASGGRRAGVAKGGQLVALGAGDLVFVSNAAEGLNWVVQHSQGEFDQFNIRTVSNSWGGGGDYDPSGAITQLTETLTYDNNVAVIFAHGNAGGDGTSNQGNPYALTPAAIAVAALEHDGTGLAGFTSRGHEAQQHTWPDIGAPGVDIWATASRGTLIDAAARASNEDFYYLAISGTSMATPHIGGVATMLWGVAPSLTTADYHHDDHDEGTALVTDGEAWGYQQEDWADSNRTRVHEIELALELTGRYITGGQERAVPDGYPSLAGTVHDWGQGHGLVDVDAAVALVYTLQTLRDPDGNGIVDHPEVTLFDALDRMAPVRQDVEVALDTDRLRHSWKGDWTHMNNGPVGTTGQFSTDDSHFMWVPEGATELEVRFSSTPYNTGRMQVGALQLTIDLGEDGSNDAQGVGDFSEDTWTYLLPVDSEHWNTWAEFDVVGNAVGAGVVDDQEFWEPMAAYSVDAVLTFDLSERRFVSIEQKPDYYSDLDPAPPSPEYDSAMQGQLVVLRGAYDASQVAPWVPQRGGDTEASQGFFGALGELVSEHTFASSVMVFVLILLILGLLLFVTSNGEERGGDYTRAVGLHRLEAGSDDSDVVEAEMLASSSDEVELVPDTIDDEDAVLDALED